jgi:transcriptional regulator with XRE-family HTH domain
MNQEAAADAANLSPKHWQDLEAGRSNPTLSSLVAIAEALNVSLSDLFAGVFEPPERDGPSDG